MSGKRAINRPSLDTSHFRFLNHDYSLLGKGRQYRTEQELTLSRSTAPDAESPCTDNFELYLVHSLSRRFLIHFDAFMTLSTKSLTDLCESIQKSVNLMKKFVNHKSKHTFGQDMACGLVIKRVAIPSDQ